VALLSSNWLFGRFVQQAQKVGAFREARELARKLGKPVLNAGSGSIPPYGDINVDISRFRHVPNFVRADIHHLPFRDKAFSTCVVSHVLEHVRSPEQAIAECKRVADRVIIIDPPIWDVGTWLTPTHRWLVVASSRRVFVPYNPAGGWSLLLFTLLILWGK